MCIRDRNRLSPVLGLQIVFIHQAPFHIGEMCIRDRVEVDALPGATLTGTVDSIGLIAHSSGGITTVPVTIRLDESPAELRVGYSASVTIEVARAENVLKVPVEAVVTQGSRSFVTVVRDGETRPVEVQTGLSDGLEVEIIAGLEPGDQIVGFNAALYGGPGQTCLLYTSRCV